MKNKITFIILGILILLNPLCLSAEIFEAEIYKINISAKKVDIRAPDLAGIYAGDKFYVIDNRYNVIATLEATRVMETVVNAKLISGNINEIKKGMKVYKNLKDIRQMKQISMGGKYEGYLWEIEVIYKKDGYAGKLKRNLEIKEKIRLKPLESDEEIKIKPNEIKYIKVKGNDKTKTLETTDIKIKGAKEIKIENINGIRIRKMLLPEEFTYSVSKTIKKKFSINNAERIKLIRRLEGIKKWEDAFEKGKVTIIGGIEFIYIPGGKLLMGVPEDSIDGNYNEKPRHTVYINSFWIGKYEVTQKQYKEIMGNNPAYFRQDNRPIEQVTWNDAMEFCKEFSKKYNVRVRLPYEAEWEYAARADSTTKYYWGDRINAKYCWYGDNSGEKPHPGGQKSPNAFEIHDITGNVWEWCTDWYGENYYAASPYNNPKGPDTGEDKIMRGGAWNSPPGLLHITFRNKSRPRFKYNNTGFRLVLFLK